MLVRVCDSVNGCYRCDGTGKHTEKHFSGKIIVNNGANCQYCFGVGKIEVNTRYIPIQTAPNLTKDELAAIAPRGDYEE